MHHPFLPLLLLVLAPLVYFSARLGGLQRRSIRWGLAACAALVLGAGLLAGGVDYLYLKRMQLAIAALVTIVLLLRYLNTAGLGDTTRYRRYLAAIAALSWVIHLNFFAFHGTGDVRTHVHLHDVAHYYLGSKYFRELGHADLYTAMLRAEAERYDNHFQTREARDLRSNRLVDIRQLLRDSAPVKAQFTPARWTDFQDDIAFFREAMGSQYGNILRDYGYNPSPLWTLIGGTLANLVPAGSQVGITLLTLIDPLLEAGMFLAIAWAFGIEAALLSMIYFCVLFGASFGWLGGAFLRYVWLVGVVLAVCCLQRKRYIAAGGLLATASLLRIFPAVFVAGIACKAAAAVLARRRVPSQYVRLLVSFAVTVAVLFAATAARPRGLADWRDFRVNMQRHMQNIAFNTIGLTQILVPPTVLTATTAEPEDRKAEQQHTAYLVQLCTLFPLTLLWFASLCRRENDVDATIMGIVLLFAGLNLACYYYVLQILLVVANRDRLDRLALIFAVEVATYTLLLFEDREAVIYFYRNLLVLFLLLALYFDPLRIEIQRLGGMVRRLARA